MAVSTTQTHYRPAHYYQIIDPPLGDAPFFVRPEAFGRRKRKYHIVLAPSKPAKGHQLVTICDEIITVERPSAEKWIDKDDLCQKCSLKAEIELRCIEHKISDRMRQWLDTAVVAAAPDPAEASFQLISIIDQIAQILGDGWEVSTLPWMSDQHRNLLYQPSRQAIHVEYHQYLRYAGRVVAYLVVDGVGYDLASAQARHVPWTSVKLDRGVREITRAIRERIAETYILFPVRLKL